jgi:cysteine synthase
MRLCGIDVLIKDESCNPFGTHKDRRSLDIMQSSVPGDVLAIISSGNGAWSLGNIAKETGVKVRAVIKYHGNECYKKILTELGVEVVPLDLSHPLLSEDIISAVRRSPHERICDVTTGYHGSYAQIVRECASYNPDVIVCPVGTGELFTGLCAATEGTRCRILGVTTDDQQSIADKLRGPYRPYQESMRTSIDQGHELLVISEEEVQRAVDLRPSELRMEPSAAVVFAALKYVRDKSAILINTGKGIGCS